MNEYYLYDNGSRSQQSAMQIWRDAHTVDQLAANIRAHLEGVLGRSLFRVAGPLVLQVVPS